MTAHPGARALIAASLATCLFARAPLAAQTREPAPPGPRVGVVLSGGSAKGLAHIGVLRVLEEAGVPVDVVTGTSMGSLVGGLYAIGYSPRELEAVVTELDWLSLFREAPERRYAGLERRIAGSRSLVTFPIVEGKLGLPGGVIGGQRISMLLSELTWPVHTVRDFRRLSVPFAAVATDIETGEAVVLDSGSVAEAMRASMSIPSVFEPARLRGRLLVDGGLVRNLPAQDARDLGADVVICSDVSGPLYRADRLRSFVDILMQSISFEMNASTAEQRRLCDVVIQPELEGLSTAAFDAAEEWIARGDSAARAQMAALREIAVRTGRERAARPSLLFQMERPVPVDSIVVEGVEGPRERLLRRILRALPEDSVAPVEVRDVVDRGLGTGQFERIGFEVVAAGADTLLRISATPETRDRLGFGFRYDDRYRAALLFTASFRNRLGFGSSATFDLRLGEQFHAAARFLRASSLGTSLALMAEVAHTRTPLDLYEGRTRVAVAGSRVTQASGFAGVALSGSATAGVQVKVEHASTSTAVAAVDSSEGRTYASAAALLWRDALDDPSFPTRGVAFSARSEWAVGADAFSHHVLEARVAFPLAGRFSGHLQAHAGLNSGGDRVPLHYLFFLGGAYPAVVYRERQAPLAGLAHQERSGQALARASAGVQWEVRRGVFAELRADAGRTADELGDAFADPVLGGALLLGARTPVGPAQVTLSTTSIERRPRLEFSIGHAF